jgi:replicative DNA helicase
MTSSPTRPSADETIRVPPHNEDAERSLLGAVLLDNRVLDETMSRVSVEDFYREQHRHVFRAMSELHVRDEPVDVITLADHLAADDRLDAAGGPSYLARLSNAVPSAANVGQYAEIVRRKAALRKFIGTADALVHDAYGDVSDVEEFMDDVERKLFAITQSGQKKDYASMREVIQAAFTQIEALYNKSEHITGVPSGFVDLDDITAGWQKSDLIIVAARPAMGKTSFTLNMATHTAVERGTPCAFFSLEMSNEQLAIRMLCSQARVDQSKLRRGNMTEQEWARLIKAAGALSEAKLFLDDTPALPIMEFRSKCRRLKAEHDIGIVFIDYLQLMKGSGGNNGSREQEISEISRNLKAVAKELEIPVVALAQLNRGVESRADKRPMMSDLRECVVGDTPVVLADGRRVPIRELVGQTPEVLAVDDNGRIVRAESDKVWEVGQREVFEVKLASGRSVTATGRHRLRAFENWKRVDEIEPGERLAIARQLPEPDETVDWPDCHVALLGQMIGDGSYIKGSPMRYTSSSEENLAAVTAAAQEFGCEVKRYEGGETRSQLLISGNGDRWHPAGVNKWLRDLGIFNQRSHQKRIPSEAFRLPGRQIALLLQHLWAADGCIWTRTKGKGSHRVYYSTNSPELARDVAALLLRLGIVGRTVVVHNDGHKDSYNVTISGATDQLAFLDIVGAFGPRVEQAEQLREVLENLDVNSNVDTVPKAVFEQGKRKAAGHLSTRALAAAWHEPRRQLPFPLLSVS